jgi:putative FmdB family regulatory protein
MIMPTYEYECKSCGHSFEAFQSMSEPPLKDCPQCGKEVRRLIHGGTGVIFKGSGFYVTDKKGGSGSAGGGKAPAKPPAAGEKPAAESAAAKTEPAAKPAEGAAEKKPAPKTGD